MGPRRRIAVALLSAMLTVAIACAPAVAGTSTLPRAVSESGDTPRAAGLAVRPHRIIYAGDGSASLAGTSTLRSLIRWRRWTRTVAVGTGADWHNDCRPACVAGTFHPYAATISLSRPRTIVGVRMFTVLRIRYTRGLPPLTRHRVVTLVLRRVDGDLFWN